MGRPGTFTCLLCAVLTLLLIAAAPVRAAEPAIAAAADLQFALKEIAEHFRQATEIGRAHV